MLKFRFKVQSASLMELVGRAFLLLSLILGYILYKNTNSATELVGMLVVWLFSVVLGMWITKRLCTAKVMMCIDATGLQQIWESQYIFYNKKNRMILWSEMASYKFESKKFDLVNTYFELKLKNKQKIKVQRKYSEKDDFDAFAYEFKSGFNKYNNT